MFSSHVQEEILQLMVLEDACANLQFNHRKVVVITFTTFFNSTDGLITMNNEQEIGKSIKVSQL